MKEDNWKMGNRAYKNRLLHCFGSSPEEKLLPKQAADIIKYSETEFLTVYTHGPIADYDTLDEFPIGYAGLTFGDIKNRILVDNYTLLINTNHALSIDDAVRRTEVTSIKSGTKLVKLEVLTKDFKRPINKLVMETAKQLIAGGYEVVPLINYDIGDAEKFEEAGCLGLRIMMADIGSLGGIPCLDYFASLKKYINIPIIAEGGMKSPVDAFYALATGADATLTNKPLFTVDDPVELIKVMKEYVKAGRIAYIARRLRKESGLDNL